MKRRKFIQISAIGSLLMQCRHLFSMNYKMTFQYEMPKRTLGKTGEQLSIVGFGGIALRNNGQDFANNLVSEAYDMGVNYFDIAPSYGDSQSLLGPALEPYRKNVFLACKTTERSKEGAEKELNESLKMMRTNHFDLYQLHALSDMGDIDQAFGKNGAMETFIKARKEGKVRFLGFSAHSEEVALKAMEMFDFDTILYPINCACWHNGNFGPAVFETAKSKNMGVLALKAVAKTRVNDNKPYPNMWYVPFEDEPDINNALRFTLSKDVTATVHAGDEKFFRKTVEFVRNVKNIIPPDEDDLMAMVKGVEPIFKA